VSARTLRIISIKVSIVFYLLVFKSLTNSAVEPTNTALSTFTFLIDDDSCGDKSFRLFCPY
jgi:hypothetical protein